MDDGRTEHIARRKFLKLLGTGSLASFFALSGCDAPPSGARKKFDGVPTGRMTCRIDRKTGNKIALLGYGCGRLPRVSRHESSAAAVDQHAVNELIDYALAHGVNYFDTSPFYCNGMSEPAVGIALNRHDRNTYCIATKLSNFQNYSRADSLAMYRNSFAELSVDYIDYYLLHALGLGGIDSFTKRYVENGMLDFLLKEREAGRIRHLGWSFHGDRAAFDYFLALGIDWDFVQIQLNYIDWEHPQGYNGVTARSVYEVLERKNIPVVVMEPLLGGRLARPHFKAQELLKQADPEASVASWAFRFAGSFPSVLTVLSGMTYLEHLQDNIGTYSPLRPLSESDMRLLGRAAQLMGGNQAIACTNCQYCMPCPYGVDIPGIFAHYNRCLNEGTFPDAVADRNYRKFRRTFLVGLDRNVETLRQANHCTGCGICVKKCTQYIDIPREMEKIDRFVEQLKRTG